MQQTRFWCGYVPKSLTRGGSSFSHRLEVSENKKKAGAEEKRGFWSKYSSCCDSLHLSASKDQRRDNYPTTEIGSVVEVETSAVEAELSGDIDEDKSQRSNIKTWCRVMSSGRHARFKCCRGLVLALA